MRAVRAPARPDALEDIRKGVAQSLDFEGSLELLRELGTVEEVVLPDLPYEAMARTILFAEAASAFDEWSRPAPSRR